MGDYKFLLMVLTPDVNRNYIARDTHESSCYMVTTDHVFLLHHLRGRAYDAQQRSINGILTGRRCGARNFKCDQIEDADAGSGSG